ncbi:MULTISPECIES: Eco57I restriction-modification methylase domain-containing protein [unclassified Pseudomonas]|uniref:Eco57I restriction-modification methylase domain-containing protein n=1 Tax=unclassified Pseudomonas TaxID=196821 RepID=UPI000C8883C0|nr:MULTISPECIES: type IIL restriction-modification enzyme MmeI [unclassified Pseudomonas]PMZ72461.1 ATP phosphoribosyltransferase regulatory subunit [Pseudomonas sp. GW247-3R2A]PMY73088.1 ATP phosphoribosyltransferase regulatory subunit [Pseudomonas sp. MPR-R3A]PMY97945.1 ATP phosphoribosyltransferase regulatory subunit [Pseudomonas sp. FW305-124]PNA91770.1 ATP phosphoribosyltransferase regulatory subunit [Pseudomonas sp. FW300-E2]PNB02862.1 ATP phosphoribosyltransferase regulatory subunit [Ps
MKPLDVHDEWLSLIEVSGPFLATPVLKRVFSTGLPAVEPHIRQYLRQAYDEWCEARDNDDPRFAELHRAWIHEVLARGLEYDESDSGEYLLRGERVPAELHVTLSEHGVTLRPDYVQVSSGKSQLLVKIYSAGTDLQAALKIDGWIASPAERMERLCRASGCRLGLVTDGERWMLVDAPVGAVSTFASWYARLWAQERLTLQAFLTLLGIRRLYGPDDETLPSMLDESLQHQEEVTDALGEQVRRAVEVLIQALDKEDRERSRTLLQGVEPAELYEAGLTIMMRLVFLLSAEERGLLLMGEEAYESNYAISTLRMQLRQEPEEVLERRNDAWSRLLATFRAVYGGIEHETLRLPALGGSLFDPNRFPFLEGRARGSDWKIDPARPLPIDNRTVLLLLEAIQQYEGRTLSYRALDVEQIGYVYEGLLERTVARTTRVTVELNGGKGAKKTLYGLEDLETLYRQGAGVLTDTLSGADAIKRGVGAIRKDLERSVDAGLANRLLTVCAGNEELRDRGLPFVNLLRTDPWGYPLIYPTGAFIVTMGSDRRESGAHYTPKSLTELIVETTLEPVTYVGPAEGTPRERWSLKSAAELLDLKICDPAMGSGAFLVQVCRWLAERIVEAWTAAETSGRVITSEGEVVKDVSGQEAMPVNPEERLVIARRLVAERCIYGVDLNPLAVELAKLSIWLITLAKGRPFGFLDHNLKCGDSLLGIHRLDQLTGLSMTPNGKGQQRLFGRNIEQAVGEAIELRTRLREMPILDIHDVEAMARLDADARRKLEVPENIADAFIGEVFSESGNATVSGNAIASLAIQIGQAIDGDRDAIVAMLRRASSSLAMDLPADKSGRLPFHWPIVFPEVFLRERAGFDGIVGNPPFLGGKRITGVMGTAFRNWLVRHIAEERRGSADLAAYFFLRAWSLLREGGGFGLLAVNTIAEGDTRQVGLEAMVRAGAVIHAAYPNEPWPGAAVVVTSRVHVHKGEWLGTKNLLGRSVPFISAFLSDQQEWTPKRLKANEGIAYQGSIVLGMGFVLSHGEAQSMLDADPKNSEVIFPYLNGEDLNSDPDQRPSRFVINFWDWPEERAQLYRLPYEWIVEKVKPERQRLNEKGDFALRRPLPERWWQYADKRPALYHSIGRGHCFEQHPRMWDEVQAPLEGVIVCSLVQNYLKFSLVPNSQVFAHKLGVFASTDPFFLGVLSSTFHQVWARKTSSTMRVDINYSPSDSFETFPLPKGGVPEFGKIVGAYNTLRKEIMHEFGIGLTKLYNRLHVSDDLDSSIKTLRELHREIDLVVANAYGWGDIELDHGFHEVPYLPEGGRVRFTISEPARIEVLRRLSALNRQRYEEEVAQGVYGTASVPRLSPIKLSQVALPEQQGLDFGDASNSRNSLVGKSLDAETIILNHLRKQLDWHSKAQILSVTGISQSQLNSSINELIARGVVERQGERGSMKFRALVED